MTKKIPIHAVLKLTLKNRKQIITVAVVLSMISGLGYYFNAMWNQKAKESYLPDFEDMRIYRTEFQNLSFEADLAYNPDSKTSPLFENEIGDYDAGEPFRETTLYNYFTLYLSGSYISLEGETSNRTNTLGIYAFDSTVFGNSRFQENFQMISGRYPERANEFLISQVTMDFLNLSLYQQYNFSASIWKGGGLVYETENGTYYKNDIMTFPMRNISICGTYMPIPEYITILSNNYQFYGVTYSDYLANKTNYNFYQVDEFYTQIAMPIFTEYNIDQNPDLDNIIYQIQTNDDLGQLIATFGIYQSLSLEKGLLINFNHEQLDLQHLGRTNRFLEQFDHYLRSSVGSNTFFDFPLQEKIQSAIDNRNRLFFNIQGINLPFLAILMYFATSMVQNNVKKNQKTFELLKIRGYGKKDLLRLFITQAIILSIICAGISIVVGFISFYLFEFFLNPFYLNSGGSENLNVLLKPIFSVDVVFLTVAVGLGINAGGYVPLLKKIKNSPYSDMLQEISEDPFPVEYNEETLFQLSKPARPIEKFGQKISSFLKNLTSNYYDPGCFEKKHVSHLLLLIGMFPIILLIIINSKSNSNSSLSLSEVAALQGWELVLYFSSVPVILPLFLGSYRFLFVESDKRLAVIVRNILHRFKCKHSELNSLLYIRFKRNFKALFLIGIMFSVNISLNFDLNFEENTPNYLENLGVGSDLRIQKTLDSPIPISSYEPNETLSNISQQTSALNLFDWEKKVSIFVQNKQFYRSAEQGISKYFDISYVFLNFSAYFEIMAVKPEYRYTELSKDERLFHDYYENSTNTELPVIISSELANEKYIFIGDSLELQIDLFQNGNFTTKEFQFKILNIVEVLPGLFFNNQDLLGSSKNVMFIDINHPGESLNITPILYEESLEMVNVKKINENFVDETFQNELQSILESSGSTIVVSFYNQNWKQNVFVWNYEENHSRRFLFWIQSAIGGLFLAIGLGMNVSINGGQEEKKIVELLHDRGFPRMTIRKMQTNLIILTALFSMLISGITSIIPAIIMAKNKNIYFETIIASSYIPYVTENPIFFNIYDFLIQFGFFIFLAWIVMIMMDQKHKRINIKRRLKNQLEKNT